MSALVAKFLEEVAEGRMPRPDSEEAKAYKEWSDKMALVSGTWAEFKLMEITSAVRTTV